MKLALIPLLIAALLMASADPDIDSVELLLSGEHVITEHRGALVVGDAQVTVPPGERVSGPIYVIGGELIVMGSVGTDVIQFAGTVTASPGADITGELRYIGGAQNVSAQSHIGQQTSLRVNPAKGEPIVAALALVLFTLLLAWVGHSLARKRLAAPRNVGEAIGRHPMITLTVGTILSLTMLSIIVFMAFTLVLIPVAVLGLLAGAATVAYGLVGWGYLIGSFLPLRRQDLSTAIGVVVAVTALQLIALVPLVGDLTALAVLLAGVGAVVVTYYGVARFQPAVLPE